ncbi:MAG: diacylglycerol kinase [Verrucomicrobiaceae bacterium]|nr:diacylglycerol kinase [Verrucomicrobiaceae bacterium]
MTASPMTASKTSVAIIVAVARNGVIGKGDGLPWRIPAEMKYFMAKTLGKPVIMGRKTFETLNAPLPRRTNIVVTRAKNYTRDGVVVAATLEEAIAHADEIAQRDGVDEIMIAGGAEIYRLALPLTDTLYYTRVDFDAEGDAHFDSIDWAQWQLVSEESFPALNENTPGYTLMVYRRA